MSLHEVPLMTSTSVASCMSCADPDCQRAQNRRPKSQATRMTAPIELSTQTEKKLVRIERDYSDGELCQFEPIFPMELDGRVNPQDFSKTIAHLNSLLQKAHKPLNSVFDNMLECLTLYMSSLFYKSHYKRVCIAGLITLTDCRRSPP